MAPSTNYARCVLWMLLAWLVCLQLLTAQASHVKSRSQMRRADGDATEDDHHPVRRRHGAQHASASTLHLHRRHQQESLRHDADAEESGRRRRSEWSCPQVSDPSRSPGISCQCDLPHTLRCSGSSQASAAVHSQQQQQQQSVQGPHESERQVAAIIDALRGQPLERSVSLLDLSIQNLNRLSPYLFERLFGLHGLVISSGEIREVSAQAFAGLASSLTALGLPNNRLTSVPSEALRTLVHLERLDLSNNRIQSISGQPFAALDKLRFLDLSGNALETIGPEVFAAPSGLRSLQLRSNLLEASQLSAPALAGLKKLQEIDLGYNRLRGRLTSSFLQGLESLVTLELTGNNLTLLKRGMLAGLKRLRTLRLARNQIDVIEDQSFVSLMSLTTLDLSHNGVVAISGQSLSHLNGLTQLDLSHNYLRAVTSDLVGGLSSLESLDLTDNDISLVEPGVLANLPKLLHLSLTDNPLNCDCNLADLAQWLRNGTGNQAADDENRRSVICATPPSLENGLLYETETDALTCSATDGRGGSNAASRHSDSGSDDHEGDDGNNFLSSQPTEDFIRLSSAQVQFNTAELEGSSLLHTVWTVDSATLPYTCDAILVYELNEEHEALLDSYPVRCHSEERPNKQLSLTVKLGENMKTDGQYRLCLVLFEGGHDDEASLLPGCSHSMTWQSLKRFHDQEELEQDAREASLEARTSAASPAAPTTQITAFYANVSAPQSVSVFMRIPDAPPACQFTVAVFEKHHLLALKRLNCSMTSFTFGQLSEHRDGRYAVPAINYPIEEYQVCATFAQQGQFLPPPDGERQADGDIVLTASNSRAMAMVGALPSVNSTVVQYEHCVVAKVPARIWAVENTLVVIAVTVVFVLIAAALLLLTYLVARRIFFRRSKLLWCSSSSDPLSSSVPKATSRHILYVPESDYFTDSACSSSGTDSREETSTNV